MCVGTKRGANYGIVYDSAGTTIGRVFKQSKDARKCDGGGKQMFYTANAMLDGEESYCSLGTRHRTRKSAVNAVLAFHASYPADVIRATASRSSFAHGAARLHEALTAAVARFKYDHHEVCALSVRNLPNPRLSWH